jgi:zeaxanthin glucosyltransferase
MARFGMFCLPWTGHLNPFAVLSRELMRRGHEVVFFHLADFREQVLRHGFRFEAIAEQEYPAGTFTEKYRAMGTKEGLDAARASMAIHIEQGEAFFRLAPPVIENAALDLWIVDQFDYPAATLAALLRAPFVSLIVGLIRHYEEGVPGFSGEIYSEDPELAERERRYNEVVLSASKPYRDFIETFRLKSGLGPFQYENIWSNLAQITQQPAEFEFPRRQLPACFHFTGPFLDEASGHEVSGAFPWEWLDGKPLIYVSFGTMLNRQWHLYEAVAKVARHLDAQIVLSLGGGEDTAAFRDPPANLLVVPFAPQRLLLAKAALMVTHAGMNSTLECLAAGVPMVAVPFAFDQLGISARIVWTGTGVRILPAECEPDRLRGAIGEVLGRPSFRQSAERFRRIIAQSQGLQRAAGIIERVAATGQPVLRQPPEGR